MKKYLVAVAALVFFMYSIGVMLPFLFSSASTWLVLLGFIYAIIMPIVLFDILKHFFK